MIWQLTQMMIHPAFRRLSGEAFRVAFGEGVKLPFFVDFVLETEGRTYEIEVGGQGKGNRQIQGVENGLVFIPSPSSLRFFTSV